MPPKHDKPAPAGGVKPGCGDESGFVASFRHWRTGELIVAKDYGKRGFPIGAKSSHKPKKS